MPSKILSPCLLAGLLLSSVPASGQSTKERISEAAGPTPAATAKPGTLDLQEVTRQIVAATNKFRREQGQKELKVNPELTRAAQYFADFMARTDKYSHTADGKEPWERGAMYGYDYCVFLENIAWAFKSDGYTAEQLARTFMKGWEKSPPHRKNLLDADVSEIGVAVAHSSKSGKYYAVQDFGRPKSQEITLRITNATDAAVQYSVDGQSRSVEPRYTVTHSRCRPPELRFPGIGAGSGTTFRPKTGAHYVIRQDSTGRLTVVEE
jgi:uncharacterized protein YkwD